MNSNDERSIVSVDADMIIGGCRAQGNNVASGLNSSSSTIKIDSLCIELGIVKEKGDVQKCRHFSIRGYVAEMREKGRSNLLPFIEQLPPIDVPQFRYWLCQRCLQNCGSNTSRETALTSVCDQSMVRPCAKLSNPQQDCNRVSVLPFGEGTSGLKPVDNGNDDNSILAGLGAADGQFSQEIPAKDAVPQEPTKLCSIDTNVVAEANAGVSGEKESSGLREYEDLQKTSIVKEITTTLVDQPFQSCQHNDYPNGPPRRKARKVRLLKELLSGNTKNQQQKKEISALRLGPRASSPSAASPQIKRKMVHDQDQRSVDITTPGYVGKKAKSSKNNVVAKTSVVEHCRDPGAGEGGQETNKYQWHKHATQRSSVLDEVGSDPVTAWRSIFSDMGRGDDQVTAASGASRPTYDISKGRGTEPYSNLMAPPPQPDKNFNASKKVSRNPLKSKFCGEDSRKINVGGSRAKDSQSDTELGLGLSLNHDPQAQVRPLPSILNRTPSQDHGRRTDFFLGESSIPHRVPSDLKSKEGYVHDVSNRHAPRPALVQEQWPLTQLQYGSCSGHQKLDFSDPYKRNSGVRLYSDVMRPHNHERQEKMFPIGRSDEREIAELMAKNQYERSLCEARSHHRPPGGSNNSWIIPNTSGFPKVGMNEMCLHQEYLSMIRPSSSVATISMMPTSESMGPTSMRNPATGFFHQDQVSSFAMFDAFSQCQKQPSSGIWISNSGTQRHHDPCYHHVSKGGNKKIADAHRYTTTNMQVLEAFSPYRNGTNVSFGQEYAKCSEKDKGKSIMNLDLNVVAPNVVEEQNNSGSLDLTSREYRSPYHPKEQRIEPNSKHISSLDSSYSNEAIPAMQLLSLMDAGKSSHHPFMDGKKFTRPLSPCYNHCNSTMAGKTNPMANSCFPYSGMRPGVQKPIGSSTHFFSVPESSSLPAGRFRTDQDVKLPSVNGHQVYHKPQEEKSRSTYSPSLSHGCRPEDAYVFPLPWHATEDRSGRVSLGAQRAFGPRVDPPGTTICTINQNPADFSTPGPENEYMIDYEDLKLRGESSFKRKSASENPNGPKRQKRP
ncbi:protein EMBRYONIC FLOWER 1 [Cynara cardunculus var. scolymus]|uniref:protein EMBRYONIC FLOWER 1 n=1 Tax=Cynara cardunculus var. scolymus TaxID=59895 RepID=UPI000D62F3A1|nr:protein EMBRYONIC FLOWER 1 [Cynara cardunculus var. scolymus]